MRVERHVVADVRFALADVGDVLRRLDIRAHRDGSAFKISCPWHQERTPSCSVRLGKDRTLAVKCHGCGRGGDVFSLIAARYGLDEQRDFREVLKIAGELAGRFDIGSDDAHAAPSAPPLRTPSPPHEERESPSLSGEAYAEIGDALLELCPLGAQPDAWAYLCARGVAADAEARGFGALPAPIAQAPLYAALVSRFGVDSLRHAGLANDDGTGFRGAPWRILIPWRDRAGRLLSLQRRLVGKPWSGTRSYLFPKGRALPAEPFGAELVAPALEWTARTGVEPDIVFCESAFDALASVALNRREATPSFRIVLGLPSASVWRPEWAEYARDLPAYIATDDDPAGEAAAVRIARDLAKVTRRVFRELPPEGLKDIGEAATAEVG